MNLWLVILIMFLGLAGSFFAWLNTSEWMESKNPWKHLLWWFISILCLGITIVSFLGMCVAIKDAANQPVEDTSRLKARCDSIDGRYAAGYCYKNGITIKWSEYDNPVVEEVEDEPGE